ncbi:MAG: CoA-acylating methylmalonate-semialdehyde dehydrogenase [Candidatus Latescibacteria bacterium]|nr:CoA-acylating methylmalonate-semialdehyde dehydrogenase [Candidatus Latescibacterota bacterium]
MAETVKLLINGEWVASDATETTPVHNPSDGTEIAATPVCGEAEVNRAVQAAAEAFPGWANTPAVDRARVMFRLVELMEKNFEALAQLVTRENGKTLDDSRGEVRRGMEVAEFACGVPALLMGDSLENIAREIDCDTIRQSMGVSVGITPFNFPFMVPMWTIPVALACGNTYVLKPSERVPLSAIRIGELLTEAGLPPGVFSIVHGGKDAVDALLSHSEVKTVSFVGSTPVAKYVYETGTRNGKRVQSAGGAKNYMIVLPDADLDSTVAAVMGSAYGCAGERCMAGSVLVCAEGAGERFLDPLSETARKFRLGPTDRDPDVQMGPVVTQTHLERIHQHIENGLSEGAELIVDGRDVKVEEAPNGFYLGATIFDQVTPEMSIAREEIFGPVLSTMHTDDLEGAIARCNASGYGNAAVLFTSSGGAARKFRHEVNVGMVGINVGVPAPMAFFPFSGWNNSFFGDLHVQGSEGISFFTRQKVTITRWIETKRQFF